MAEPTLAIDFTAVSVLSFDCYGTLIDWEPGILDALSPVLAAHGIEVAGEQLLEAYGLHEAELEAGPYMPYTEILACCVRRLGQQFGYEPSAAECERFARSVGDWPAFPDSAPALARLKDSFRLAVITNCDDDLFALSYPRLGVEFDWVITAQQARSYKPSLRPFELAFEQIDVPRERIVHVAQSIYHDHEAANPLGLNTVWINRRHDRPGPGATRPGTAAPNLTFPDMHTFAELATTASVQA
jgi:2-haloacid dehalogenase